MRRKLWLLLVIIPILGAAYMLRRPSVSGSPISSPEPVADTDAQARALIARLAGQPSAPVPQPQAEPSAPVTSATSVTEAGSDEQGELRAIDAYAARECEKIEACYSGQLAELKAQLEQKLRNVDGMDKQVAQQDFQKAQESLARMQEQKMLAVKREADRRRAVVAQKNARAQAETARKQSGDQTPTVNAVLTAADNRLCALVGDALVYEGDMVQGYRVRRVRTDSVEFEKDGETWVQEIQ